MTKEVGPFTSSLSVGEEQSMTFNEDDVGPFWMTEDQKISSKCDVTVPGKTKKRNELKAELLIELL